MIVIAAETRSESRHESKKRILNAALQVTGSKGYSATRIEDVCEVAGHTKGSFFYHFSTKEKLAIAAADYWSEMTSALFASAPYHAPADPLERVLAYVDFRKASLRGELPEFTCLVGTMTQEVYGTHPAIREAAKHQFTGMPGTLVPDIEAATEKYGVKASWSAESLALFTQGAIQGAFFLAKAKNGVAPAIDAVDHLHRYIELLFNRPNPERRHETR